MASLVMVCLHSKTVRTREDN